MFSCLTIFRLRTLSFRTEFTLRPYPFFLELDLRIHSAGLVGDLDILKQKQVHEEGLPVGLNWLTNPENMSTKQAKRFPSLQNSSLKTARAWAIKEMVRNVVHYVSSIRARKGWEKWWAMRCQLDPGKDAAKTIQKHLWGILNAIILRVINSQIKTVKTCVHGFRDNEHFVNNIYSHLGGLDLLPKNV